MAYRLNDTIRNLTPYDPITGDYAIRLDANESFLALPHELLEQATLDALNDRANRYPDPYATLVCKAFAELYGVPRELVTAGNGSDELISLLAGAFFEPGDELVTLSMDFSMYRFYGEVFHAKTTVFPKKDDLTIDVPGLIDYLQRSKARGLIFSNPCNPTSICLGRKQVLRLVKAVPDCLVVVDEAYMDFADDSVLDDVPDYPNLMVLRTCSKAFGLAAIRLGFAVAGPVLTKALRAVKSPYNVNALTQSVAYQVLSDGEYLIDCIETIIKSRDHLYSGMLFVAARHKLYEEVYPTATNFICVRTPKAREIYEALLGRSIAVRYFREGYLRISAGTRAENEAVLTALDEIAEQMEAKR